MKTYTNKSNAARAAKKANGGSLTGLELKGEEGAWYYAPKAGQPEHVPQPVATAPAASLGAAAPLKVVTTPDGGKAVVKNTLAKASKAPAKKAAPAKKSAPVKKAPAKKVPAKKAAPVRKAVAKADEYDVRNGPTQGRISGYHIDPDRDEKHGVKRRSAGTIGGRLWAIFDAMSAKAGGPEKLEIAVVKEAKAVADFNPNKVVIEFYYWRRYHGVRGRGRKQKVAK